MEQKRHTMKINGEKLKNVIHEWTSIREFGPIIGYNEKTIRRGIKSGEISMGLALAIANEFGISIYSLRRLIGE